MGGFSGFDDGQYDDEEQRFFGMYIGEVVDRDPELRRVKVKIPGLIEPSSAWAFPLGGPAAGGSKGVGFDGVPRLGAAVAIWFNRGDPDHPYYQAASQGRDEIPAEVAGKLDAQIWSSENWGILLDDTQDGRVLQIINRKTGDLIEMNAEENSITIQGTTSVDIQSIGIVNIDAPNVQIKGRKVTPSNKPI